MSSSDDFDSLSDMLSDLATVIKKKDPEPSTPAPAAAASEEVSSSNVATAAEAPSSSVASANADSSDSSSSSSLKRSPSADIPKLKIDLTDDPPATAKPSTPEAADAGGTHHVKFADDLPA